MIIGGSSSQDLAAHVARELGEELCYVETKKFPDGERYLSLSFSFCICRVDGKYSKTRAGKHFDCRFFQRCS